MNFLNANSAFDYFYELINDHGHEYGSTKCFFNVGFKIQNPLDNKITVPYRKWSETYAIREWKWYLSGDRSVKEIKKHAKIWGKMHHGDDIVNSNYGYQWSRNDQLRNIVNELKERKHSRRAVLTIYDGKEHDYYALDTPCTLNIHFYIRDNKLEMTVMMRSNDLWFGFCNDQYCFSNLQRMIAEMLEIEVGSYYHFASNLHLYNNFLNKRK